MSQSSIAGFCVPFRSAALVLGTWLLTATAMISTASVPASEAKLSSGRSMAVIYELPEEAPEGTMLCRLRDHNLTLSNFRYAADAEKYAFTVDPLDGTIRVTRPEMLSAETQSELQLSVIADEELAARDPFLDKFSAGLLEEGFSTGAFNVLSSRTVSIEITIRLRELSMRQQLPDTRFLVQAQNEATTGFGTVAVAGQQPFEPLRYFIVSGNEDDVFQINEATGTLSLRGSAALQFEMFTSHELVVLVENTAGQSSTANVDVTVFNETPLVHSPFDMDFAGTTAPRSGAAAVVDLPVKRWAGVLPFELPFGIVKEPRQLVPGTSLDSTTLPSVVTVEQPELPLAASAANQSQVETVNANSPDSHSPVVLLNTDRIDTEQVRNWIGHSEGNALNGPTTAATGSTTFSSPDPVAPVEQSSQQGVLQSVLVFFVFLLCSVIAAVVWSRAAAARRAAKEEEATPEVQRNAESLKVFVECNSDSTDPSQVDFQCQEFSLTFDELSEQVRTLQEQLADRDQKIEKLTKNLLDVCRAFDRHSMNDNGLDSQSEDSLLVSQESPSAAVERPQNGGGDLPQDEQVFDLVADARSGLTAAQEQLAREVQQHSLDPDAIADQLTGALNSPATVLLDDTDQLRSEFSDLFAIHRNFTAPAPESEQSSLEEVAMQLANIDQDAEEGAHLDTVKYYLSELLSRSKDGTSPDAILVNRRKTTEQTRDTDRRSKSEPKPRKPVVSFLDSYMQAHGGELAEPVDSNPVPGPEEQPQVPAAAAKPRAPIDVNSIRESMNSFRAVAMQSVQNAVLTHDLRQAKGKVAIRTLMIAALVVVTAIVIVANTVHAIQAGALSWLMAAAVVLAIAELCLRMQRMRIQRKGVTAIFPPTSRPGRGTCVVETDESGDD